MLETIAQSLLIYPRRVREIFDCCRLLKSLFFRILRGTEIQIILYEIFRCACNPPTFHQSEREPMAQFGYQFNILESLRYVLYFDKIIPPTLLFTHD